MITKLTQCAAILAIGISCSASQAATLFVGADFGIELLYKVDTTSPTTPTLVGSMGTRGSNFGLADHNGRLFTFDQFADEVLEIDPTSATVLKATKIDFDLSGEGSIAIRGDGKGFLTTAVGVDGEIRSFDIDVEGSTAIGSTFGFDGSDFQPGTDTYYGLQQNFAFDSDLYTIDTSSAAATLVGLTGISDGRLGGLTFSSPTDLFAVTFTGLLYRLDPDDGSATLLGDTGLDFVWGLSALEPVIPEPTTFLLTSTGLAFFWGLVRLRSTP